MTTDPATWREAARQLREEAEHWHSSVDECASAVKLVLDVLARRFENEAKAAEPAFAHLETAARLLRESLDPKYDGSEKETRRMAKEQMNWLAADKANAAEKAKEET